MLDMLAGRIDVKGKGRSVTGSIQVGAGVSSRYVQQEDSLVGILTVRESLVRDVTDLVVHVDLGWFV